MTAQDYVNRIGKASSHEEVQAIVTRAQYDDSVSHYDFIDVLEAAMKWDGRRQTSHPAANNVLPFPARTAT